VDDVGNLWSGVHNFRCSGGSRALQNWIEQRKKKEDRSLAERLFLVHAVLIGVRGRKSRMTDTALITMYEGERRRLEIPDFALDMHTSKGRRMDRGVNHFFDEGAKCANEAFFASKGSRALIPT
jgi:hypothetical protein